MAVVVEEPALSRRGVAAAMVALGLGGFGIGTTEFATMGLLPQMADTFGISIPSAGHAISLYALGVVVGAPLIAGLGAKLPRKGLLIVLVLGLAVGNGLSAIAWDPTSLLAARFLAGLPHGAYFGIAAVVASSLVPPQRRGTAVARIMIGLTVANLIGVPVATAAGQRIGWRAVYLAVAVIAVATAVALWRKLPHTPAPRDAGVAAELRAFRRPQVWFALVTGMVGFGGMFAVYSYVSPLTTEVAGLSAGAVPWVLAVFGLGMTLGATTGGRFVDRSVMGAVFGSLVATTAVLVLLGLTASVPVLEFAAVFLLGFVSQLLASALQVRLMDASPDAPSLASSSNHSALNVANGAGAWLGGLAIAAGWGYASTAWVGVALSVAGLAVAAVSVAVERRSRVSV
ncbi:putative transport transmembrane protein [Actinokineospora spheciospongiae]|uniref:Putative transport transmembrane protein n=1 Tax=Actinokineospora spheciospongiae TaxID=909613 RepID=W7IT15_9PSEU|nr:MFS transporter [Actinokineospora spheciospongiae]EWC59892.1 putative transport transmembrane protein [Actinokineospora spheciospongiae]PWW63077.1 DHA1 family inner membrane transport protein [Actinokineospora spheciospongiae]